MAPLGVARALITAGGAYVHSQEQTSNSISAPLVIKALAKPKGDIMRKLVVEL